jgi:hypothetical protein
MASSSSPQEEGVGNRPSPRQQKRQAFLVTVAALTTPPCVGVAVGARWAHGANEGFYTTAAQVIATLFVAVTVDFFARAATKRRPEEGLALLVLVLVGWTGFFCCLRALASGGTAVTAGAAAAGVTATQLLTSLALYDRILSESRGRALQAAGLWLAFGFMAAPVVVVVVA